MNDYQQMSDYLHSLSGQTLLDFFERVHNRPMILLKPVGKMSSEFKQEVIDIILGWKGKKMLDWKRACHEAGIDVDPDWST